MICSVSAKKGSAWKRKQRKMETISHQNHIHHDHHHKNGGGGGVVVGCKDSVAATPKWKKEDEPTERVAVKSRHRLWSYHELPDYMKDNEFIRKYYRVEWPLKRAFFSLFQWHNETLNVWTHLLGFVLFVGLTVLNIVHIPEVAHLFRLFGTFHKGTDTNISHVLFQDDTAKLLDLKHISPPSSSFDVVDDPTNGALAARWPLYVFLAGSMFCLLTSSVCHLFSCHSNHVNSFLLRIDYVGITIMIIASFFPPVYYIFMCEFQWQVIYLTGISLMGLFTVVTLLSPTLSSGKCRGFRAALFCSMGLFGLVPAVHGCVLNWGNPRRNATLVYESAMALSYLIGTGFYVGRVPERFKPGWFDLAGHSHQIFHVFVVLGALAHYAAALLFIQWRDLVGCST